MHGTGNGSLRGSAEPNPKPHVGAMNRHDEGGERRRPNVRDPWRFRLIAWNAAAPPRVADFARSSLHPRRSPPHTFLAVGNRPSRLAKPASRSKNRLAPRLPSRKEVTELGEQMRLCFTPCGTIGSFFRCQIVFFVQHRPTIKRMPRHRNVSQLQIFVAARIAKKIPLQIVKVQQD